MLVFFIEDTAMNPAQCRAARAMLEWTQPELAKEAGVSASTIRDFESSRRIPIANNLAAIERALTAAGVLFIDPNGNGPGVRLRDR
ncbi:helix-turn-helix domain-containing protein [Phyllobacterium meliloti]|uniref:helix-turn-helix domain-containing protein n=1 Tax=Phyllobacterium meliloti TaxID=555317 RepID=UPI00351DA00E